jgi:hypothetical protein
MPAVGGSTPGQAAGADEAALVGDHDGLGAVPVQRRNQRLAVH